MSDDRRRQEDVCTVKFDQIEKTLKELFPLVRETREAVFNGLTHRVTSTEEIVRSTRKMVVGLVLSIPAAIVTMGIIIGMAG